VRTAVAALIPWNVEGLHATAPFQKYSDILTERHAILYFSMTRHYYLFDYLSEKTKTMWLSGDKRVYIFFNFNRFNMPAYDGQTDRKTELL